MRKDLNEIIRRLEDIIELCEECEELFHDGIDEDIKDSCKDIIKLVNKLK